MRKTNIILDGKEYIVQEDVPSEKITTLERDVQNARRGAQDTGDSEHACLCALGYHGHTKEVIRNGRISGRRFKGRKQKSGIYCEYN